MDFIAENVLLLKINLEITKIILIFAVRKNDKYVECFVLDYQPHYVC